LAELFGDNDPGIATFVSHNSDAMDGENSRVWAAPFNPVGCCGYNHIENFSETAADLLQIAQRFVFNSILECSAALV
jgi:hypothetical protein